MKGLTARQSGGLAALVALAAAVCIVRLVIGRDVERGVEFSWPQPAWAAYRWNALMTGAMVGASLAIAGLFLQALLRNPLAEPFILGLSSGAGLGVMIAMFIAYRLVGSGASMSAGTAWWASRTGPAIVGALAALAVVYALGQRRGWLDPVSLVLVGVIVSAICGAGIMFFQHAVDTGLRSEFTLWLMGYIPDVTSRAALVAMAAITGGGILIGMFLGRAMDAATLGDDEARSIGLAIGPLRLMMFALASILAAGTVAMAGPIGFVGLIAPHAARLLLGPRHTPLVVGAALAGIALVVGSDVLRQAIDIGGGRMPIGIFTALIGGPAFIWLLLSGRGQS